MVGRRANYFAGCNRTLPRLLVAAGIAGILQGRYLQLKCQGLFTMTKCLEASRNTVNLLCSRDEYLLV